MDAKSNELEYLETKPQKPTIIMNDFSSMNRKNIQNKLTSKKYDVLVIGGGITGAGIALDAASRGLSVALIEKKDFASGTSSRSTKLVHGGLRYLEHLEFRVVSQVGKERDIVYSNAPHIVLPEKMLLPITKDGKLGMFTSSLALQIYDYLAGVKKSEKRQMLSLEETIEKEPLLAKPDLIGGALYYEYKTNDARLVIEVLKRANEYGVTAINYLKAEDFIYREETIDSEGKKKITGVLAKDEVNGVHLVIDADVVVNAAGVWTDQLRDKDGSLFGKRLHHTKGVHIVVSKKNFNLKHAIYFDVGDGRMVFAIPRFDVVYVGTTDTDYYDNPDNPEVNKEDVTYLVNAINAVSPSANLLESHVESSWAGLRPLIHEDGKSPSELSRKDEIFYSKTGLISITGGKLTGYRLMAKKVVNKIIKGVPEDERVNYKKCQTKSIKLSGGEFNFSPSSKKIKKELEKRYSKVSAKIGKDEYKTLFYKYGTNTDIIVKKAVEFIEAEYDNPWLRAELWYGVNHEMVATLSDFFIRRTGMIHFFISKIEPILHTTASILAEFLLWDEKEVNRQIKLVKVELEKTTRFTTVE